MGRHKFIFYLVVILSTTLSIQNVFAGVTGKISGIVFDKETREPLAGVNIMLEGTMLGAATDSDGRYFILQVKPGIYSLHCTMIGYKKMLIRNVKVMIDHTTRVDIEMEGEIIDLGGEVVVTAKRKIIQKDVTTSTQFVGIEEIEQLPVSDAREGIMLQTGVIFIPIATEGGPWAGGRGEKRYVVRGGEQDQVKWFINGVRSSALVEGRADVGGSFTNINLHSVEEVQIITSGFNAEYGEAQSGIVNVVTKEGSQKFTGAIEYIHGLAGQHHFGKYLYDRETQKEFLDHTDSLGVLDTTWWTPFRQKNVYDYRKIPDHNVFLSLGGPLFEFGQSKATFFLASQFKKQAYTFPHPRDTRNLENVSCNIGIRITPKMKLRLTGLYNHEAHSTLQEYGSFVQQAKYYRGWGSLLDTYTNSGSIQWNHAISQKLFYDLKLSYYSLDIKEKPGKYTELGISENPTLWGYQPYNGYPDEPYDAYAFIYKNHIQTGDISLVGSANWQLNYFNFIKSGFEVRYNTMKEKCNYRFTSYNIDPEFWFNRGLHETYHPIQFAAFVQDKMEFESMILNFGVRFDRFDPNYDWFVFDPVYNYAIDPEYDKSADPDLDQVDSLGHVKYSFENAVNRPREKAKAFNMISPRLGVSFPVTEKTLLHFNYGHFYQMPPLDKMFNFSYFRPEYILKGYINAPEDTSFYHVASKDGDPERVVTITSKPLKPEKTISFEVGVKHNFSDLAVLDITAYYKDVFDQTEPQMGLFDKLISGWDPFKHETNPSYVYASLYPGDYGDARGFEISLRTLFSRAFTLDVNYTFSRSTSGRATPWYIYLDGEGNATYKWATDVNKRIPVERSFNRPHILRTNIFLKYPDYVKIPVISPIFRRTTASFLYRYVSGQAFTYIEADDPPDTYNNYRYPASQTVDLKLEKLVSINKKNDLSFYVRITNLLNTKNIKSIGDIFFDAECVKKYIDTGKVTKVDGAGYDISWNTYYEPRRIYFGLKCNLH